jgi:drug/metabolite transporter (DMT)-like permease
LALLNREADQPVPKSLIAAKSTRRDNVTLAIAVILATNLALSLGDAAIKQVSASFVLWQIFVIRSTIAIPIVILIIRLRFRETSLLPRRPGWVALRSLMLALMWIAYYAALTHLALGIAAAVYYTLPIFITLFAALFIGDRIGPKGWLAVLLGFLGVLLILKPSAAGFNAFALLPLASAILYAQAMILTRTKCREENPLVLSLSLNIAFVSIGLLATVLIALSGAPAGEAAASPFLFASWSAMGATQWLGMGLLVAAIIIGSVGAAFAYQVGRPATVATFDFAYVGFATVWGMIFFAESPDSVTIAGMLLIVSAGILAVRR